jgi:DNA adenine methylase
VINDLDGEVVNLFQVLRDPVSADRLCRLLADTPYARGEYLAAVSATESAACPIERARRMVVRSHMGHGTSGSRFDRVAGFRMDGRSGTTNCAGEWAELPESLRVVRDRLRGVSIEQLPAVELLARLDGPQTLFYLDPPYLPETRTGKSRKAERYHTYRHEMTVDDHRELLAAACASQSMVMISGYPAGLYDEALKGWHRITVAARAHRNSPRTECLWLNPAAARQLQPSLPLGKAA